MAVVGQVPSTFFGALISADSDGNKIVTKSEWDTYVDSLPISDTAKNSLKNIFKDIAALNPGGTTINLKDTTLTADAISATRMPTVMAEASEALSEISNLNNKDKEAFKRQLTSGMLDASADGRIFLDTKIPNLDDGILN